MYAVKAWVMSLHQYWRGGCDIACLVQYVEEPVHDIRDLAAFFDQTHIPLALDETLDETLSGRGPLTSKSGESRLQQQISGLSKGAVAALVVKPGVIGGFERAACLSQWAAGHGIQVRLHLTCCTLTCTAARRASHMLTLYDTAASCRSLGSCILHLLLACTCRQAVS